MSLSNADLVNLVTTGSSEARVTASSPAARVRRNFLSERPSNPATIRWESILPTTSFQTVSLPVVQSLCSVQMLIRDFCWSIWMIRLNTYLYTSNNGVKPKTIPILCLLKPFTVIINKYFCPRSKSLEVFSRKPIKWKDLRTNLTCTDCFQTVSLPVVQSLCSVSDVDHRL